MVKVHYFFDPMCGWCYGATPLVGILAEVPQFKIIYNPGGMISKQEIDSSFRQHILRADDQIAAMTKAHFGDAYKTRVASSEKLILDSYLPTQALLVASEMGIKPHIMLKEIQTAHYQDGKALGKLEVLEALAVSLGLDEAIWNEKMAAAEFATKNWIQSSHNVMGQLQVSGYPTLIVEKGGQFIRMPHSSYYGKLAEWKDYLHSLR